MSRAATPHLEAKSRAIVLISVVMVLSLIFQPAVSCSEDEDRASAGDWIYLTIVAVAYGILMVVIVAAWRRRANPHTDLPGRIRRARARGPLKK